MLTHVKQRAFAVACLSNVCEASDSYMRASFWSLFVDDAIGTPRRHTRVGGVGNCARDWTLSGVFSLAPPNKGHHGWTYPRRTAFHRTVALPSLPETHST